MDKIAEMAWNKKPPTDKCSADTIILYCISRALYADFNESRTTRHASQKMKADALTYYETIKALARSNTKIIIELNRSIAPRADLVKKDKAELVEIITRIEGVVYGLMQEFDGKIPEFLKLEDRK